MGRIGAPCDRKIFEATFEALERGLWVEHIATFCLRCCSPDDSVHEVLRDPSLKGIDCIPVRDKGGILGVIDRTLGRTELTARESMQPLAECILVEASTPLKDFLPKMEGLPFYRLVVKGTSVKGIVTRSDIQKLPVRILAFGAVTHLEMSMARLIESRYPSGKAWLRYLSRERRTLVRTKFEDLQKLQLEVSMLEATEFCDKVEIVRRIMKLTKNQEKEISGIENLRNPVFHARSYANSYIELMTFLRRLRVTESWIGKIEEQIEGNASSATNRSTEPESLRN